MGDGVIYIMFCLLVLPCLFIFAAIKDGIDSRRVDKEIKNGHYECSWEKPVEEIRKVNPYYHMTGEEIKEWLKK